jgi:hypothetical protein
VIMRCPSMGPRPHSSPGRRRGHRVRWVSLRAGGVASETQIEGTSEERAKVPLGVILGER